MKWIHILCLSCVLGVAISCGSSSSSTAESSSNPFILKANVNPGDTLRAYALDGSIQTPGELISESVPDALSGISELQLRGDQSYRIRLKRSGVEFVETIILQDQFSLASGNTLDVGELSASTTLMTWAAYETQSVLTQLSMEQALLAGLDDLKSRGSSIKVLSDIRTENIDSASFGVQRVHQINLLTVLIARLSYRLDEGTYSEESWNAMREVMIDIFAHYNQKKTTAQAESLITQYRDVIVEQTELPKIESKDIQSLYVENSDIDLDTFILQSQSSDLDVLKTMFKAFEADE